jgi:hypothetical protein
MYIVEQLTASVMSLVGSSLWWARKALPQVTARRHCVAFALVAHTSCGIIVVADSALCRRVHCKHDLMLRWSCCIPDNADGLRRHVNAHQLLMRFKNKIEDDSTSFHGCCHIVWHIASVGI